MEKQLGLRSYDGGMHACGLGFLLSTMHSEVSRRTATQAITSPSSPLSATYPLP